MKTLGIPVTSGSKYDVWASAVLHGIHSGSDQSVAFVAPLVLCLIGLVFWPSTLHGPFPWVPTFLLVAVLAAHLSS